jgi:hypothetical protein
MKEKYGTPKGVRITQRNCDRLEHANRLGIPASKVINEILDKYLVPYLEAKGKEFNDAIGQVKTEETLADKWKNGIAKPTVTVKLK